MFIILTDKTTNEKIPVKIKKTSDLMEDNSGGTIIKNENKILKVEESLDFVKSSLQNIWISK